MTIPDPQTPHRHGAPSRPRAAQPDDARLADLLPLARVLWSANRALPFLRRARPGAGDVAALGRSIRRGWVRLARDRSGPAAFIARDGATVHALYVHPRAHGCGLATALLNEAKRDVPLLELWTPLANARARAFYRARGFVELAEGGGRHNDAGLPDVYLRWQQRGAGR